MVRGWFYGKPLHRWLRAVVPGARCTGSQAASRHRERCTSILVARQPFGRFYSEADKKLKKVDISGGSALAVCAAKNGSASGAGGGAEQVVISPEAALYPEESLPDGSILAVNLNGKSIVRISPSGGKPESIFHTDFESDEPHVSPDGRWIACAGNESGQWEIYIAAFPSFNNGRQASNAGGIAPVWRADGKELFYVTPEGKLMSVSFRGGAQPETSVLVELFQTRLRADHRYNQYTVTGDGQRFLMHEPVENNEQPYYVVMNWTSLLKH
jgi:hypothetical protein